MFVSNILKICEHPENLQDGSQHLVQDRNKWGYCDSAAFAKFVRAFRLTDDKWIEINF